jgi:hypothetical protein
VIVSAKVIQEPLSNEVGCQTSGSNFGPWGVYFEVRYYAPEAFTVRDIGDLAQHVRVRTSADMQTNSPWYSDGTYPGATATGTLGFGACSANDSTQAEFWLLGDPPDGGDVGSAGNSVCLTY